MATSATQLTGAGKALDIERGYISFETTDATVEVTTGLSAIYGATFTRIGAVDASDAGYPSLSETATAGVITPASNAVTVVRQPLLAAGTLTGETFYYEFVGKS